MAHILRTIDHQPIDYWLIKYDKHGNEVLDSGELASEEVLQALKSSTATDVYVVSHGWKGTWESAQSQYDRWIAAVAAARPGVLPRDVRPFVVGVHWPAQWFVPMGVDRDSAGKTLAGAPAESWPDGTPLEAADVTTIAKEFAAILGDTPQMRNNLERALTADALGKTLDKDRDAEAALAVVREDVRVQDALFDSDEVKNPAGDGSALLGGGPIGFAITALRQLSFWTMKRRAYIVGASGVAALLRDLQEAAGTQARLHLMGHSLGCIVMSSAVYSDDRPPAKPVSSMLLVEGALSLWAYADNAFAIGRPGRFRGIRDPRFVAGSIVTTQSEHDKAVGFWYPKSAAIAGFVPGGSDHRMLGDRDPTTVEYGALGAWGAQDAAAKDVLINDVRPDTTFARGAVYNVDASTAIVRADGKDAHGDIASPPMALLAWRTVLSAP